MTRPTITTLRLLSAPEFATASEVVASINEVSSIRVVLKEDNTHALAITAPARAVWLDHVRARRIVRLAPPDGEVSEWVIGRDSIALGDAADTVTVACDPLYTVMADVGVIEYRVTGGMTWTNLSGRNLSARNFINTFIVPTLTSHGINWIKAGTTDPPETFDLSFDGITPLALLVRLATRTGTRWRLRRDAPNSRYLIDLVDELSPSSATVWATQGRNALTLVRQRTREGLYTVIRPVGALPDGAEQRADIGHAVWDVTVVATDVVTLASPNGGDGPVLEDDQHVGSYLQAADGTFHEIDDSDGTAQTLDLELGAGASFAVGDRVVIVADVSGTLLTELVSPSGLATYGRAQGRLDTAFRGEANHCRNPGFGAWDDTPLAISCLKSGASTSSTSQALKGLPPGLVVKAGDALHLTGKEAMERRITGDQTVDGSGNVTVTISVAASIADDDPIMLWRQGARLPPFWTPGPADNGYPILAMTPVGAAGDIAAKVDGNQTIGGGAAGNPLRLNLKDMVAATAVYPGSLLVGGTQPWWIATGGVADSLGDLTVEVMLGSNTAQSYTGDADLTIKTPELGTGSGKTCSFPHQWRASASYRPLLNQTAYVRHIAGQATLRAHITATAMNRRGALPIGWNDAGADKPPALQILDDTLTVRATATAPTWAPSTDGQMLNLTLSTSWALSASGNHTLRILPPYRLTTGGPAQGPWYYVHSAMFYLGSDANAPFVDGSHATRLFQAGNLALLSHRQWPATYVATVAQLVDEWGIDPTSPALGLGGTVRLRTSSLNLDLLLTVVGLEFDPFDHDQTRVMLDTSPTLLSGETAKARPRPVYVNIDVEVVGDTVRKTVIATEDPPIVDGSPGSVLPDGSDPPEDDTVIEIGW